MIRRDALFTDSIRHVIKENLSERTLEKIESRLDEKHNMPLPMNPAEFAQLEDVLREFFGDGAERLKQRIMAHMIELERSK